jgi:hypothetical protein
VTLWFQRSKVSSCDYIVRSLYPYINVLHFLFHDSVRMFSITFVFLFACINMSSNIYAGK